MQEIARSLFPATLVIFVFSTMLAAGLSASWEAVARGFRTRDGRATGILVLVVNLMVVPLMGVVLVNMLSLSAASAIGLLLLACSPGAPFAVKILLLRRGDVAAGAPLQLLLAIVGTVTFVVTADVALSAVDLGTEVRLPVVPLMVTVAVLQLTPFAVGVRMRTRSPELATRWLGPMSTISSAAFVVAVGVAVTAAGPELLALPASSLIGAAALALLAAIAGYLLALGGRPTRAVAAILAPMRATGPPFAAIAVAYANDPAILGAITGQIFVILAVAVVASVVVPSGARGTQAASPSVEAGRG